MRKHDFGTDSFSSERRKQFEDQQAAWVRIQKESDEAKNGTCTFSATTEAWKATRGSNEDE